jgi:hypothetical protein
MLRTPIELVKGRVSSLVAVGRSKAPVFIKSLWKGARYKHFLYVGSASLGGRCIGLAARLASALRVPCHVHAFEPGSRAEPRVRSVSRHEISLPITRARLENLTPHGYQAALPLRGPPAGSGRRRAVLGCTAYSSSARQAREADSVRPQRADRSGRAAREATERPSGALSAARRGRSGQGTTGAPATRRGGVNATGAIRAGE